MTPPSQVEGAGHDHGDRTHDAKPDEGRIFAPLQSYSSVENSPYAGSNSVTINSPGLRPRRESDAEGINLRMSAFGQSSRIFDPAQDKPSLLLRICKRRRAPVMPTETLIFAMVILTNFAVFAGTLAWADFCTRGISKP